MKGWLAGKLPTTSSVKNGQPHKIKAHSLISKWSLSVDTNEVSRLGNHANTKIAPNIPTTPPHLLGHARKIA